MINILVRLRHEQRIAFLILAIILILWFIAGILFTHETGINTAVSMNNMTKW